MGQET